MMSLKYDDIEKKTTTSKLQQEPSDDDEVDEVSEYDSTLESFRSSGSSSVSENRWPRSSGSSSVSENRWPPCREIEEIDQGWILFSRTSSSKSSISSFFLNKAHTYPQPWRLNWMKRLFGSSGTVGKPNPITPVVDQLKPSNIFDDPMETVTVGEWGALKNGFDERAFDHRGYDGIQRIIIYCGELIDSIRIQYTKKGALEWTEKIGGNGGRRHELVLDDPDEYITKVMGYYNINQGISHLTFISNRKMHRAFGINGRNLSDSDIPFQYSGGKLIGFKGAGGRYLSSIGFNVSYLPYSCENEGNKCIMSTASTIQHVPNISQVPCRFHQIYVDMFGYIFNGEPFKIGEYDGIKKIFIGHGKRINFFMVEYMKNGRPQLSQGVGKMGGSSTEVVLDYPREFLQTVKGNYLTKDSDGGLTSLTFYSNLRKYGPFGYERGQQLEVSGGKIVGFRVSGSEYRLRAVGFHIVPTKSPNSLQEL